MLKQNQIAVYDPSIYADMSVVNMAKGDHWLHHDNLVILTKTGALVNDAGIEVGQAWYSASRATLIQRLKALANVSTWFPLEFDL